MISQVVIRVCFLFEGFSLYFGIVCVRWCVCLSMFVFLHDYIGTKCFNSW